MDRQVRRHYLRACERNLFRGHSNLWNIRCLQYCSLESYNHTYEYSGSSWQYYMHRRLGNYQQRGIVHTHHESKHCVQESPEGHLQRHKSCHQALRNIRMCHLHMLLLSIQLGRDNPELYRTRPSAHTCHLGIHDQRHHMDHHLVDWDKYTWEAPPNLARTFHKR